MKKSFEFTIIVPVYNEIEGLDRLRDELKDYLDKASKPSCVLFVDDGSTDGSREKIEAICRDEERFSFVAFRENRGLSSAIKAGIDYCQTPLLGYIDADLQTTPRDFEKLLKYIDEYDAVLGYRARRRDTVSKKIQSKIANTIRRSLIDDGIIDTGCPLKVFKSDICKRLPFFDGMHRFWGALILLEGGSIKQVAVSHFERVAGESKFNLFNRSIKPFQDLFAYRWMRSRYIRYEISSKKLCP